MYLFPRKLTEIHIATKMNKANTKKTSLLKELDVFQKWKSDYNVFVHFEVLIFCFTDIL